MALGLVCYWTAVSLSQSNISWYTDCQKEVYESGSLEVSFVLKNAEGKNVKFPNFDGFIILSGPSTSRSVTIINGAKSSSLSFSFVLQPKKTGNCTIAPAIIEANGKTFKTEPVNVSVVKSNIKAKDLPNSDIAAIAKMKVSPTKAYVGQQIIAQYIIYYGENIGFSEEPLKPDYEGFFVKDLKVAQSSISGVKVGNKQFEGILLDAVALYPQKTGILKIGPTIYQIQKRIPGFNPFQNPFGSYVQKNLTTNEETIDVKALPQGAPGTFSGGVGEYRVESTIDNSNFTTNQSIHLKLTILGTGDSRQVGPPVQNFGPDFEVFPARTVQDEEFIENNIVWHKKVVEYLITPKSEGTFTLKPMFSYFDTNKESYVTLESKTPVFTVKKEKSSAVNFFKGDLNKEEDSGLFPKWVFLLILPFIFVFTLWLGKSKPKSIKILSEEQKLELKKQNAGQLALLKLRTAKRLMDDNRYELFYKEIGFAINNYLQSKYGILTENLNKKYIQNFLSDKINGASIAKEYTDIIEKAELSMYAGYSDKNVQNIFESAKNFISVCELKEF